MLGECEVLSFRNVTAMEADMQMKRYFVLQVK
jgi:hypothetical protein